MNTNCFSSKSFRRVMQKAVTLRAGNGFARQL